MRSPLFLASTAVGLVLLAWLYASEAPLRVGLGADALHHMAAVRELARGEFPPRHNLVVEEGLPQGHYGPYLVALGVAARWTGAGPRWVLHAAGLVNLLALAVALRSLAARTVGEGAAGWSLAAALLLWGPWPSLEVSWPSWRWPGSTSLADAQNFFYPQAAGLVLLAWALRLALPPAHREGDLPRRRDLVAAWVLVALLIATHALTAIALGAALAALAADERLRGVWTVRRAACLLLLPAAGLALAASWPYYPVLGLLEAATLPGLRAPASGGLGAATSAGWPAVHAAALVADPLGVAAALFAVLGPAVVGVVGCVDLARRGRPFLLAWFAVDAALAASPWLPLRERFVFFAAMPAQLGAAGLLHRAWRRGRLARGAAVGLLLAGALSAGARIRWLLDREVPDLSFVARLTPEDAVVLADLDTANGVAGLAGRKVVAPQHPDLFLVAAGGWQRVLDVQTFLDPRTDPATRDGLLRRWRVTHVLLDRLVTPDLELPHPVVHDSGGYVLYDVRQRR